MCTTSTGPGRGRRPARRWDLTRGWSTSVQLTPVEDGGWGRNLADHIVALSEIVDHVHELYRPRRAPRRVFAGRNVLPTRLRHTGRPKPGQRRSLSGSPVDTSRRSRSVSRPGVATGGADFLADHVFNRLAVAGVDGAGRASSCSTPSRPSSPARLPPATARPRGAAAPRTAARGSWRREGWVRLVRSGCRRTAQAVRRAQPDDVGWVRHPVIGWSASTTSPAPSCRSSARSTTSVNPSRCAVSTRRAASRSLRIDLAFGSLRSRRRPPAAQNTWPTVSRVGSLARGHRRAARTGACDGVRGAQQHLHRGLR